jgi:hypothetical protein
MPCPVFARRYELPDKKKNLESQSPGIFYKVTGGELKESSKKKKEKNLG